MNLTIAIANTLDDLAALQRRVERHLIDARVSANASYLVRLAIEELVSNVIRHGYDDEGRHQIQITVDIESTCVGVVIDDDGRPFDPNARRAEAPVPALLADAPTGGMGLTLVRSMAGPLTYQRICGRNRVGFRIGCQK